MSNVIIGIVGRDEKIENVEYQAITKNNLKYLHGKVNYIGIINYNNNSFINENILSLCDGIIFQGGNIMYPYHFEILKYAIKNKIPVLGICMGHQIIGLYSNNGEEKDLIQVSNHYIENGKHSINIKKDSFLYNLFGSNLLVNSRHYYKLKNISKPFNISACSNDGVIEALEYIDKNNFIIGVQFHPEDMENMEPLYSKFFKEILRIKYNK